MKLAIVPTVASPCTASQPPTPATIARPRLLTTFISGPMKPAKICARVAAWRSSRLAASNSLDHHLLAVVGLDHALAGDRLFDQAVERAQRRLLACETACACAGRPSG